MTAPLVSFSGLASGFDYRSLVDAIIAQERVPATRLETQLDTLSAQQNALGTYRTQLDTLRTAAAALRDGTAFDATTSTTQVLSGSRAVATVTTSPDAAAGSFRLAVSQLARTEKLAGTGQASSTDPLGVTGSFALNGVTIDVSATDSLADLRDRINALNSGATPLGVSATILSVAGTDNRLVLTSATSGADGISLSDTSGTVLEGLGFLSAGGVANPAAVLVDGADAVFTIDGITLTRTSNSVTDAIAGVTLTLTSDEAGAVTDVTVGRFADAAHSAMQAFVDAYNSLVSFIQTQDTASDSSRPPLYNDSLLRGLRRDLPTQLLTTVFGAQPDLATAASVGLSLDRTGKLSLDSTTFATAFNTRYDEVRALFGEERSATSADVSFVSSGSSTTSGTWDVEITAPATAATLITSGFGGVYDAGATPDTLQVTDTRSGLSVTVDLTTGMTTADIVAAIQTASDEAGLNFTVVAEGNDIRITHGVTGSAAGLDLSVTGVGDGAAEAWSGPVVASGTDVTGTIGGFAATGSGSVLVGNSGTDVAGLSVRYSGTTAGAAGSISLGVGTAAAVERLLDRYVQTGGLLDTRLNQWATQSDRAQSRIDDIDARLDRRRANLLARFVAMEAAIARLQQSSSGFLNTLSPQSGTK
jgi:flagellar hook-associated protein 2